MGYLIRNDFKCKDKDKFERSKGTGKKIVDKSSKKTGKYGYLRGFSINTAHGQSQLSQGKVRGLHTNIPPYPRKIKMSLTL